MRNNLTKAHVIVFVGMLVVFTILTFLITNAGIDDRSQHNARVLQATIGTIAGPLTGAISLGFQDCCLRASLTIMAYCAPILVIAIFLQFARLPQRMWAPILQIGTWAIGWLVWFLGGILSFGHALS